MRRAAFLILIVAWTLTLAASGSARQTPTSQTFRSGIDIIQLDVSVLDKDRHPVRGLTAANFTVAVDGQPRPVVAFKAVELQPPAPAASAPWLRDVAPDVATNTRPSGRVVVIVIDDGSFQQADPPSSGSAAQATPVADQRAIEKAREVARAAVRQLGPDDLAAVAFTENNHTAQSLTSDRVRLLAAIDSAALTPSPSRAPSRSLDGALPDQANYINDPDNIMRPACRCNACSIEAVGHLAESLGALPQQRKILLYVSAGVPLYSHVRVPIDLVGNSYIVEKEQCNAARQNAATEVFRKAALSNVTIQSIDPKGGIVGVTGGEAMENPSTSRIEFLRAMAEETGGRAVVNNNEMDKEVPTVLEESSSYYLLGVEAPPARNDGRLHPIQVRVNRRDLEVRTRTGYYDPTERERKALASSASPDLDAVIANVVPKNDVPLDVAVAPFATSDRKATLALVLSVNQPVQASARGTARTEPIEIVAAAFNSETGGGAGTQRQKLNVEWNPTNALGGQYEVLSRLPLAPGRYELRLGLKTGDAMTASVYTSVDVPNFTGDVAVSGLVLGAVPSPKMAPADAFADLMPIAPTARRLFRATDQVTAFLRVYQDRPTFVPAKVATRITDVKNEIIAEEIEQLDGAPFGAASAADHRIELPVQDLQPGEYLLTVDVSVGDTTIQRALRFRVE